MAEAPTRPCRFFCHQCSVEISPRLPDFTCPRCDSGFIEELAEGRSTENGSPSTSSSSDQSRSAFESMDHQHLFTFPSGYGPFALGIFDENLDLRSWLPTEDNRETENRREREMASRQRYSPRQPRGRHVPRRQGTRHEGVPTLEGIIQQLVNGIIAPTAMANIGVGPWGMLHSNPMDYAWGANGLDSIITQTEKGLRVYPPSASQRNTWVLVSSVLCAKMTTVLRSTLDNCHAITCFTMSV
ncbi:putative E3 ubiquitin-protein ligase RNF126-like isoform 3 [Scophthalmus maximus]|uniref:RING-type E3 ubiquitin transferase n=1 Tax=Scophthalmus maximus TaxID=52904 RepID=A0A2U9BJM5_SCOMX|nr:putative E3 ubiquitin-protein ligase RNF126-like isoform 3 [Scophthalmus maximus]